MIYILGGLLLVLFASVLWLGATIAIELYQGLSARRTRPRFSLADMLLLTTLLATWLLAGRMLWTSFLLGPTMLFLALMMPLVWLVKSGWQERQFQRQRRLDRRSDAGPKSFVPQFTPKSPAENMQRLKLRLRSRASSLLQPRLSRYSLSQQPLRLDEK